MVCLALHDVAQDGGQQPAIAVVIDLHNGVEAGNHGETERFAIRTGDTDGEIGTRLHRIADTVNAEGLVAGQAIGFGILAGFKLKGEDAHPH